jgi:hypothetical protein
MPKRKINLQTTIENHSNFRKLDFSPKYWFYLWKWSPNFRLCVSTINCAFVLGHFKCAYLRTIVRIISCLIYREPGTARKLKLRFLDRVLSKYSFFCRTKDKYNLFSKYLIGNCIGKFWNLWFSLFFLIEKLNS